LVAVAALAGAGRLLAEVKGAKPAAPRTRVALVNLSYVIKNYARYKDYQDEMKEAAKTYQERDKKLRAQAEKLAKGMGNSPVVPAKSDDAEEKLKKVQREIEDNALKAKKALGKLNDEAMKTIFTDLTEACERYASAHDLDLVMHYNEGVTPEEVGSTQNIARKLQSGPLMPIYSARGMEISKELVELLNHNHAKDDVP
jgi:Skp family chaperone for outer membrane proteins